MVLEEANQDSQLQGQPADRPSTQKKVLYIRMLQKPRRYYNYLNLWCWLQATDNLISDGPHLRDIFRESLLRTANGNPIANKGQVHGREKGLDLT